MVSPTCMNRSVGNVSDPGAFPGRSLAMAYSTSSGLVSMLNVSSAFWSPTAETMETTVKFFTVLLTAVEEASCSTLHFSSSLKMGGLFSCMSGKTELT